MALGAWRISRRHVLTRRAPVIEALGAATMLFVDKTGTLTGNRMTVKSLYADGELFSVPASPVAELPERFHRLVEYSVLASEADPFDSMEKRSRPSRSIICMGRSTSTTIGRSCANIH